MSQQNTSPSQGYSTAVGTIKKTGTYIPKFKMKGLNVAGVPIRVKSTNNMKKKSSKSFRAKATKRRMSRGGAHTNYMSAVKAPTSGRPGAGKTFTSGTKGANVSRTMQVSPAQRGAMRPPTSSVSVAPSRQNKQQVSNGPKGLAAYKKSIRKSMGYSS